MSTFDGKQLLIVAADLIGEDSENSEYDRAIAELVCTLLGESTEHKYGVLVALRAIKEGELG